MAKIDLNAPITLGFSLICLVVFFAEKLLPGVIPVFFSLRPTFELTNPLSYLTTLTYIFGHADWTHIFGNLSFILLLGPVLEERYGMKKFLYMITITTITTAITIYLFFTQGIMGASGVVFMCIILVSFANAKRNSIPLTFILVTIIFLGKEFLDSFNDDQISQTAHLAGGLCGGIFGLFLFRR